MASTLTFHICKQEGFASQVEQDWLARIYFLSFNITSMVIFEVVISFIVEAFVFKMLARQRNRVCPTHNKPYCQCKCAKCKHYQEYALRGHGFNTLLAIKGRILIRIPIKIQINFKLEDDCISIASSLKLLLILSLALHTSFFVAPTACGHKKKVTITLLQTDVDEIKQEHDSRHTNSTYTIICNFTLNHSRFWKEDLSVSIKSISLAYAN